jgi:hypothetical protein
VEVIELAGEQLRHGVQLLDHGLQVARHPGFRPVHALGGDRLGPADPDSVQQLLVAKRIVSK